jgi:Superinfection immunity protein
MTALVTTFIVILLYLLPTVIAASKHRSNVAAICALNLLLGWTVLGWIGALVWALTDSKPAAV